MKKILCIIIMFALVFTMSASVSANNLNLLSNLSDEECMAFIKNEGVSIPDTYEDEMTWLPFIRHIIQQVEENPNAEFLFGYTVPLQFANEIKKVVNEYYGTTASSTYAVTRSVSVLQDNTVYGAWKDEYTSYNCYAYAIGYSSMTDPGKLKWVHDGNSSDDFEYNDKANIYTIANWVKGDLESMGCTVEEPVTEMPNTDVGGHTNLICVRKDTTGYNYWFQTIYDYHFMKLGSDGYWYHKPGQTNPLRYKYTPSNSRIWVSEGYNGQSYFRNEDLTYESAIYYIEYTSAHSWGYEYYGNDCHIKTCTICGVTSGTAVKCLYVNDACGLCGHCNYATIDSIDGPVLYE